MKTNIIAAVAIVIAMASASEVAAQQIAAQHKGHHRKTYQVVKSEKTVKTKNGKQKAIITKTTTTQTFPRTSVKVIKQRTVRVVQMLPDGYSTVPFGGATLYHYGGRYYNLAANNYTAVAVPMGLRVKILPMGHRKIFIGAVPHYYYAGTYYRQIGDEYEAIEPSIGAIVPELPEDGVEEVVIDGQMFYEYDNVLYKSVVTKTGVQYEVAGKLGK
jgi:hypothetical protein